MTAAAPQGLPADRSVRSRARARLALALLAALGLVGLVLARGGGDAAVNLIRHGTPAPAPATVAAAVNRPAPIVYRPSGFGARKLPLVVALYGSGGCPQCMQGVTDFERLADAQGFVVAYPGSASSPPWNAPSDLGYVRSFLEGILRRGGIDLTRVYLAGFSAGGRATYQYGCALNAKLAAIAVVSSVMRGYPCALRHPLSELTIDGGSEHVALWGNGDGIPSAASTAARWRRMDGCRAGLAPDLSFGGVGRLVRQQLWGPCANGSRVGLYVLAGGYHTWPGTSSARGPDSLYNASLAIWHFFSSVHAASLSVPDAAVRGVDVHGLGGLGAVAGSQTVAATLSLGEPVSVRMQVVRGAQLLTSGPARRLGPGRAVPVSVSVPGAVRAGLVNVRLVVWDAYGRSRAFVVPVRLS